MRKGRIWWIEMRVFWRELLAGWFLQMSAGGPPLSAVTYNFFVWNHTSHKMDSERDIPLTVFKPHVQTYAIVYSSTGDYDLLGHGFLSIISDEIDDEIVNYL